jgi:signal recognition particle GTPase
MSSPDGHLVRKAFLTKYGYAPDLTYEEILSEFQRRYDHAQTLRQKNAGLHRIMLIIEGMAESAAKEEASRERAVRKLRIERLTEGSGYGVMELDQLVEGFAARLEVEWIQRA